MLTWTCRRLNTGQDPVWYRGYPGQSLKERYQHDLLSSASFKVQVWPKSFTKRLAKLTITVVAHCDIAVLANRASSLGTTEPFPLVACVLAHGNKVPIALDFVPILK